MIHIIYFSDGHKHFDNAVKEYQKRLQKKLTFHGLKPTKHTNRQFILQKEFEKLEEKLQKIPGKIFVCDENGEHINSQNFAKRIQNVINSSENIIFIIGGSYGIDLPQLQTKYQTQSLKLSEFVMPHALALLVLTEQIYRSFEIIKGSGYHH